MRVVALDTHDGHFEGEEYEVSDQRAEKLIKKGLVKAGEVPKNKKAAKGPNERDPSAAAGRARPSSASRAVRASKQTTVKKSAAGVKKVPTKRAPRKKPAA